MTGRWCVVAGAACCLLAALLPLVDARAIPPTQVLSASEMELGSGKGNARARGGDSKPMVYGVCLGGWLVMEPWITPSMFDTINLNLPGANLSGPVVDEWTYWLYGNQTNNSTDYIALIKNHWNTWITEDHVSRAAAAGITHLRVPVGYWMFDARAGEPWLNGADHFPVALDRLKTLANQWAKAHNLKVLFDLHGAPGSQNGFDNSGRRGDINLLQGDNLERTKGVVEKLTQWVLDNIDPSVVHGIEVLNEPNTFNPTVGNDMWTAMKTDFYPTTYQSIRELSNNQTWPNVIVQSAFRSLSNFNDVLQPEDGYSNVYIDDHNYQCFGYFNQWAYESDGWQQHLSHSCDMRSYYASTPLWTFTGEFSLAVTDCTKYLLGIGRTATPIVDGHARVCDYYNQPVANFTDTYRAFLNNYARAQMDAFEQANGWFFWTLRTENSPAWDFLVGLEEGWMPNPVNQRKPYAC